MSWVGRVTRRPTFGSEQVWCRLLGQKEFGKKREARIKTTHVTRGNWERTGLKAISTKYLTANRTGALERKKYSKSGVLNALLRTFGGIEKSRQTQAPEATRFGEVKEPLTRATRV